MSLGRTAAQKKTRAAAHRRRVLAAVVWAEWLMLGAAAPVALAVVLTAPPRAGLTAPGVTFPWLPGISFAPFWVAGGAVVWDWLAWEILMAAVLTLATLALLKIGRVMALARWEGSRFIPPPGPPTAAAPPPADTADDNGPSLFPERDLVEPERDEAESDPSDLPSPFQTV